MAIASSKIVLSGSRDIPFNRLMLSQNNVRRVKAGVSVEQLAEDIARRTLLQSLSVRPIVDKDGKETGKYEVPAGGRRFRALQLLVKQKRLTRTAPVPCVVRTDGLAEEDSLAENVQRAPLLGSVSRLSFLRLVCHDRCVLCRHRLGRALSLLPRAFPQRSADNARGSSDTTRSSRPWRGRLSRRERAVRI
jgi:hypothetical protein